MKPDTFSAMNYGVALMRSNRLDEALENLLLSEQVRDCEVKKRLPRYLLCTGTGTGTNSGTNQPTTLRSSTRRRRTRTWRRTSALSGSTLTTGRGRGRQKRLRRRTRRPGRGRGGTRESGRRVARRNRPCPTREIKTPSRVKTRGQVLGQGNTIFDLRMYVLSSILFSYSAATARPRLCPPRRRQR